MTPAPSLTLQKRLRYALETAVAYGLYGFFWLLPLDAASAVGGRILSSIGPRLGISRVARKNLRRAFPEKTETEREAIVKGMWDNLGRVIAEYPHLHHIWSRVELIGGEHLEAARDGSQAAIFIAAHLANWEIQAISAKETGLPIHVVYRKPNNPWVDGLLRHARNSGAVGHIVKGADGAKALVSILKKGGAVGLLMDQKLNEGMPIPFFGRDAMTAPAAAQFALKFGCPLHPARVERLAGAKFRLTVFPALEIVDTGNKEEDIRRVLVEINTLFEVWIRERPDQWLWLHRRWPE